MSNPILSHADCPRCGGTGKEIDPVVIESRIEASGLSSTTIAAKIGVTPQWLCDIRKGRRRWTPALVKKLVPVLNGQ